MTSVTKSSEPAKCMVHRLPLRKDVDVDIELPRDMSAREADRVCTWIRSIALPPPRLVECVMCEAEQVMRDSVSEGAHGHPILGNVELKVSECMDIIATIDGLRAALDAAHTAAANARREAYQAVVSEMKHRHAEARMAIDHDAERVLSDVIDYVEKRRDASQPAAETQTPNHGLEVARRDALEECKTKFAHLWSMLPAKKAAMAYLDWFGEMGVEWSVEQRDEVTTDAVSALLSRLSLVDGAVNEILVNAIADINANIARVTDKLQARVDDYERLHQADQERIAYLEHEAKSRAEETP